MIIVSIKIIFKLEHNKAGDTNRTEGQKQNIQIDKKMAAELINLLNQFVNKS